MKKGWILICCLLGLQPMLAQELDMDLKNIMERMESIVSYEAEVTFNVDVSFIKMPTKKAAVKYTKAEGVTFDSDDFVLIPKKGLDFSLNQLLDQPILTVNRGDELLDGRTYKVVNIIPTTDKSDFSIAKLFLDTENKRVRATEISTKKEGVYWIDFSFNSNDRVLPSKVTVTFEVEKFRIPINFMGKDTEIDRKEMRREGPKKGSIYLDIQYRHLEMGVLSK